MISNTYHRDGTVTFWSIQTQAWRTVKASRISDATLATMNDNDRERIKALAAKQKAGGE